MNVPSSLVSPRIFVPLQRLRYGSLSLTDTFATLLIFLYWLLYENVIFFYPAEFAGPAFSLLTNGLKILLPVCLLLYSGLPGLRMLGRGPVGFYLLFFVAFLLWGLVPTLISGDPLSWVKLLPRFLFFLSVVAFFSRKPAAFAFFAKCMILYVLSALVQYVLIYATGSFAIGARELASIYGRSVSMMWMPGLPFPIVRLCGFWNEPSNASASAYAAFFLARYLVMLGEGVFWRWASYAGFVAGALTLSNAGYFALGSAVLFGLFLGSGNLDARRMIRLFVLLPVAVALLGMALFGRIYVSENLSDSTVARAITGTREVGGDPYGGRLSVMDMTFAEIETNPIGVGIQTVGSDGIEGSGTAPLLWLLLTGIPGLILLIARDGVLLVSARSLLLKQPDMLPLIQALIVVIAQQGVYGSWMNPNYFILAAMVLVCSHRAKYDNFYR